MTYLFNLLFGFFFLTATFSYAKKSSTSPIDSSWMVSMGDMKFRNIGPAFLSGRISDIAIHPHNENTWYVAVASGGVWKTVNAGTTWQPIFDDQSVYSIGCVTIDSQNPEIVWVGTGENVGGRHIGFGDGVYKSLDGGKTWKNMGLKSSEHISKIIIHPNNSNIVWVAVQGPLWSKGGERGLYKTTDGGVTWKQVLGDDKWVGVTDIVADPRNPDRMYAATWQRHRTVATLMGGGPGTALYRTEDGGENWKKLTNGLPTSNMGKIGLAVSPQQPDVVYAAIELDRRKGGVFRSTNRGESWEKRSDAVSGATGPHYYQELYASPHQFDKIFLMDVRVQVSSDGGKTFTRLPEKLKHSDNHAIVFKADDPNYIMLGTDAGIYETFDNAKTWRYIKNLPVTQYYKVAVNNAEPFYQIFGGTQDNGSTGGPSRTDNAYGITNADWFKTLGADGHQSATDPQYNNIIYAEGQEGWMHRVDLTSGEATFIQPQPRENENFERFNWDVPILVSPHTPSTLYTASYRVWKSENRGDSWTPISGDLTRNEERIELPIMGKQQSWDNPWDMEAMSNYNTITSLAVSPVQKGLIYAGTDDGLIQVTEDGGKTWQKIEVSQLPNTPSRAFINDIKADLYDAQTVYVSLDNHKEGDFQPYLFKSTDKGATWIPLMNNLPEKTLVWRLVQDHINPKLLFVATEFGVYYSRTGGDKWSKIPGSPTISFRDLAIQKRENDLVAASFGRGFFILDDYSALRELTDDNLAKEGHLFAPRKAWLFNPRNSVGNTGHDYYTAPNPKFGALVTYHLSEEYSTMKQERQKKEKKLTQSGQNIPFAGWDKLQQEKYQEKVKIWIVVKDQQGRTVSKVQGTTKKGINRVAWNLRYPSFFPVNSKTPMKHLAPNGPLVTPGEYMLSLYKEQDGKMSLLHVGVSLRVEKLYPGVLGGVSPNDYLAFKKEVQEVVYTTTQAEDVLLKSKQQVNNLRKALTRSDIPMDSPLYKKLYLLEVDLRKLEAELYGRSIKSEVGEKNPPSIYSHLMTANVGLQNTTGYTTMHKEQLSLARNMSINIVSELKRITTSELPQLINDMKSSNVPYVQGIGW